MKKTTLRLTMWPDRDVKVSAEEEASLRSQGLIMEPEEETPTGEDSTDTEGTSR